MSDRVLKRLILIAFAITAVIAGGWFSIVEPPTSPPPSAFTSLTAISETMTVTSAPRQVTGQTVLSDSDLSLLPAWRWSEPLGPPYLGLRGIIDSFGTIVFSWLSMILFAAASLMWWLLREVIRFGLTANFVGIAAYQINETFASIGRTFGLRGADGKANPGGVALIVLLAVPLFITLARFAIRRQTESLVRTLVWFLIPIALLQVMLSTAAGGSTPPAGPPVPGAAPPVATSKSVVPGSPAWFALVGVEFVDDVSGLMHIIELPDSNAVLWASSPDPSCGDYVRTLYDTYATNGAHPDLAGVSRLWEVGFASNWFTAQFGNEFGGRIGCFYLEKGNEITPQKMREIAVAAGFPNPGLGPFDIRDGGKYTTADMYAWAACQWNGAEWVVTPGFDKLQGSAGHSTTEQIGGIGVGNVAPRPVTSGMCANWWNSPGGDAPRLADNNGGVVLEWSTARQLDGLRAISSGENKDTPQQAEGKREIRKSIEAFWGWNGFDRLIRSVIAVFAAALYLWGLGGLAIGAFLAQLGLVVMLALAPLTLVLLALPTKNGSRNPLGIRLTKLTVGFLASKLVLSVVIALTIRLILLIDALLRAWAPPQVDWLVSVMAPAAALLLLRKILKSVGLGDMMKLSGSVGMTTAVAAGSDQGVRGAAKTGALRDKVSQTKYGKKIENQLDRADAAMSKGYKTTAQTTVKLPFVAASSAGNKALATAKERFGKRQDRLATPLTGVAETDALQSRDPRRLLDEIAHRMPTTAELDTLNPTEREQLLVSSIESMAGVDGVTALLTTRRTMRRDDAKMLRKQVVDSRNGAESTENPEERRRRLHDRQTTIRDSILENAAAATGFQPEHIKNGVQRQAEADLLTNEYGVKAWVVSDELYAAVPAPGVLDRDTITSMTADQKRHYVKDHPSLIFSTQIRERFNGESDTDYVRRMNHLMLEMGLRDASGATLDVTDALNLSDAAVDQVLLGKLTVGQNYQPSVELNQKIHSELGTITKDRHQHTTRAVAKGRDMLLKATEQAIAEHARQTAEFDRAVREAVSALGAKAATQAAFDDLSTKDQSDPTVTAQLGALTAALQTQDEELVARAQQARTLAERISAAASATVMASAADVLVNTRPTSVEDAVVGVVGSQNAVMDAERELLATVEKILSVEALALAASVEGRQEVEAALVSASRDALDKASFSMEAVQNNRRRELLRDNAQNRSGRRGNRRRSHEHLNNGPGPFN